MENQTDYKLCFKHTVNLVTGYLKGNRVPLEDLANVINSMYRTALKAVENPHLLGLRFGQRPAVPIEESVKDDYIVCLEDGKKLQMLKRHLWSVYNLSLKQYFEKWGLPKDYPTVCANYSKRRSGIAKSIGLGKLGGMGGKSSRQAS